MDKDLLIKKFKKSDSVVFRKVANEYVLVPIHKDAVDLESLFSFNMSAARIWELIDAGRTGIEIAQTVASEFDQQKEQMELDVLEFLAELKDLNFILEVS